MEKYASEDITNGSVTYNHLSFKLPLYLLFPFFFLTETNLFGIPIFFSEDKFILIEGELLHSVVLAFAILLFSLKFSLHWSTLHFGDLTSRSSGKAFSSL